MSAETDQQAEPEPSGYMWCEVCRCPRDIAQREISFSPRPGELGLDTVWLALGCTVCHCINPVTAKVIIRGGGQHSEAETKQNIMFGPEEGMKE